MLYPLSHEGKDPEDYRMVEAFGCARHIFDVSSGSGRGGVVSSNSARRASRSPLAP